MQMKSNNFRVLLIDMPYSIKGTVGYDPVDDYYTIYINERYCQSQQLLTYFHELQHIEKEDFAKVNMDAGYLETIAH